MKKNKSGAGCPRQAMTHALRYGMGMEREPSVYAVTFASICDPSDATLIAVANTAIKARLDIVAALWADDSCKDVSCFALILRSMTSAEMLGVEPAQLEKDKPLVLISKDQTRLFFLNERAIIVDTKCSPGPEIDKAIKRGKIVLRKMVSKFRKDPQLRCEIAHVTKRGALVMNGSADTI